MNTYRAEIIIKRVVVVEVEASSDWHAKDAILHNQGKQVGDEYYQSPRIENLKLLATEV
ncbi:hypothetical protein [Neptuniibacter marinus]|jgi:hypothetical protein|uniref:hypothetical protein n=1 Tax=Neptuniibacter marinus TaxID=1806670 RepID=UPI000AC1D2D2|nr:hypothetical protein [Neptuniibacter marinus]